MKCGDFTRFDVHLKYLILFGKQKRWRVVISEKVIHTYFIEKWDVFHNDSLIKCECVIRKWVGGFLSFENEKLILFLLIFDEVLSTDNCEPVFAIWFLDTDDFIGLSRVGV